jgi:hypothetical protein
MSEGDISRHYRAMSAEDRRTFDRWLKANVTAGLIIASGLVAMALLGSNSAGPGDATLENNRVVIGLHNKMQAAAAHVMPAERLAKQHTKMAAPGTATK